MRKSFILVGIMAVLFFTNCSDSSGSSPSKTLAEKCANGMSAECIEGSWAMKGFYVKTDTTYSISEPISPADELIFTEDGKFEMHYTSDIVTNACNDGNIDYGTWSVTNSVLTLKFTTGNCSLGSKGTTLDLKAAALSTTQFNMGGKYFHEAYTSVGGTIIYYEIFDRISE
ncbi:MAG: lipocalin family protein [Fibrobacteraceae bacterium]|nr:lipocalin family protein [Fibrobacteraceae bacterium]